MCKFSNIYVPQSTLVLNYLFSLNLFIFSHARLNKVLNIILTKLSLSDNIWLLWDMRSELMFCIKIWIELKHPNQYKHLIWSSYCWSILNFQNSVLTVLLSFTTNCEIEVFISVVTHIWTHKVWKVLKKHRSIDL